MKRKFLAKAITLGLMLAVPFGAEAENVDDGNNYINEGSSSGAILSVNGSFERNVQDKIIITNINKGSAVLVNVSGILNLTASNVNIKSVGGQAFYIVETALVNINSNEINLTSNGPINNKGIFNINQGINNISDDSKLIISGTLNNSGIVNFSSGSMSLNRIFSNRNAETNITATSGDIEITLKNGDGALYFNGKGSINAENGKLTISAPEYGIRANSGSNLTIDTRMLEVTSDKRAIAVYDGGIVNIKSKNVNITSKEQNTSSDLGIAVSGGSILNFTDNVENVNINSNIAVKSTPGNATSNVIIKAKSNITINGDIITTGEKEGQTNSGGNITIGSANSDATITIEGDIYRGILTDNSGTEITKSEGGSVNIILNNKNSSLTGNIYDNDAKDGDVGKVKLEVKNGATWKLTGNSTVKEVKSDGGVIDLDGKGDSQNVEIKNLKGTNTTIKTDSINNKLTVGNNETKLDVKASSKVTDSFGNDIQGGMKKLLDNIDIKGGTTKETTVTAAAGSVTGEVTASRDAAGNYSGAKEEINKDNAGISEMASIGLMTWRAEKNDMNKRLGELRSSQGEHGVWTRMVRGQSKYGAQNVKNQYSTYQLGYDEKLSVDKHWTVGAAVSYTDASSSFTTGSGKNKSTGLAVYGSYLGDNGSFVDLIAKVARLKNEFDVLGGAGKGDYETNGYSISAEYGKRFTKDNGFWIEPQVELTYGYVGAVDYLTSNDVSVRQNGMDSLVGRVGFSLGRDIKAGNVYARASYLYDFDGETDVTFSKDGAVRGYKQDLGGSWWEVGIGTNINLSDATHLYFDVEKTYGGNVATPWQWNAGVRWSF